jgi:hypothetical protein
MNMLVSPTQGRGEWLGSKGEWFGSCSLALLGACSEGSLPWSIFIRPTPTGTSRSLGSSPRSRVAESGRSLLAPVLEIADQTKTLCYLETPFPRTHAFCERLGFVRHAEHNPRRTPGSYSDEIVIAMRGVDVVAWEHLLNDGAKECREGNAAPEAIVEEVSNDRVFGEGAREQSTRLTALVAAQSFDVDVRGAPSKRSQGNETPGACGLTY